MGVHRHLYGKTDEVQVTVRETVTVKPGDLIFLCGEADIVNTALGGASATADNYAYPFNAASQRPLKVGHSGNSNVPYFIGVAMEDSANGATDTISVATKGVFRFPLSAKGAVTVGAVVSCVRPSGFSATNSTTASYQVRTAAEAGTIGYCIKTESGASNIDFRVRTLLGDGTI